MPASLQVKPRGTQHRIPPASVGDNALISFAPMGLNFDHPAEELGPDVWTQGAGVLFRNDAAERQGGELLLTDTTLFGPQHLLAAQLTPNIFWLYAGAAGVGVWDGVNHFDISPTTPPVAGGTPERWTSTLLNNLPVLNLEGLAPWFWDGVTGNPMEPLPGFPALTTAGAIRAFKFHLIAMNITTSTGQLGTQLLWSASADPGNVPATWIPAPENDAGDNILAATPGDIVDGHALRDTFVIFKQHSAYLMQYVGGQFVFLFRKALVTSGVLSRNCIAEVLGNLLVLTDGDVVLFDGQDTRSLLQDRLKRWMFSIIDGTTFETSFVVANPSESEVWVCFPETGNAHPNVAAVWDRNTDSWGVRSLFPETTYIGRGIIPDTNVDPTWDGDGQNWDLDDSRWNQSTFNPTDDGLISADEPGTALIEIDAGLVHSDGTSVEGLIGKDSMLLDELSQRKLVTAVIPRIVAAQPVVLTVRVGVQETYADSIAWTPEQEFDPAANRRIDVLVTGRYLSVRFSSRSDAIWRLEGFSIQVAPAGVF